MSESTPDSLPDLIPEAEFVQLEPEQPITNLLTIPKELALLCFNFLFEMELYRVQQTCRGLLLTARDPNALHHLDIRLDLTTAALYFSKPLFSRIKILSVSGTYIPMDSTLRSTSSSVNMSKWASTSLSVSLDDYQCPQDLPLLSNLQSCSLHRACVGLLGTDRVNFGNLRALTLSEWRLDRDTIDALSSCVGLEQLSLRSLSVETDVLSAFQPLAMATHLMHLTVDVAFLNFGALINLLLSEGARGKTFEIVHCRVSDDISDPKEERGTAALLNVDRLVVGRSGFPWTRSRPTQLSTRDAQGRCCGRSRSRCAASTEASLAPSASDLAHWTCG